MMTCPASRLVCFCCAILIGLAGALRAAEGGSEGFPVAMVICGEAGETVVWMDGGDEPACLSETCALCVLGAVAVMPEMPQVWRTDVVSRLAAAPWRGAAVAVVPVAAAEARAPPIPKEIA